jgi:hypothetical protein
MWQALRDLVNTAKESLGIELPAVPDTGAVTDMVNGAGEQAGEAVTTATDAAASATGDAATSAGEQLTGKVSDLLGRFGG